MRIEGDGIKAKKLVHISSFTVLFVYLSALFGEEREMRLQKERIESDDRWGKK